MPNQEERAELHKTIWKIANDLRGSVDGWEFKAYVLGSIFYRFISENICDYIHQIMTEAGQPEFDYAAIDDAMAENIRKKMVEEKGYFILPSQLFQNVVKSRCTHAVPIRCADHAHRGLRQEQRVHLPWTEV